MTAGVRVNKRRKVKSEWFVSCLTRQEIPNAKSKIRSALYETVEYRWKQSHMETWQVIKKRECNQACRQRQCFGWSLVQRGLRGEEHVYRLRTWSVSELLQDLSWHNWSVDNRASGPLSGKHQLMSRSRIEGNPLHWWSGQRGNGARACHCQLENHAEETLDCSWCYWSIVSFDCNCVWITHGYVKQRTLYLSFRIISGVRVPYHVLT